MISQNLKRRLGLISVSLFSFIATNHVNVFLLINLLLVAIELYITFFFDSDSNASIKRVQARKAQASNIFIYYVNFIQFYLLKYPIYFYFVIALLCLVTSTFIIVEQKVKINQIYRGTFEKLSPIAAENNRKLLEDKSGYFDAKEKNFGGVSLVITIRNEDEFIHRTIQYTLSVSPKELIKEIIIVDDNSKKDVGKLLENELTPTELKKVKLITFTKNAGLIRGRLVGADASSGKVIVFLDGHCRPKKGWLEPLIHRLRISENSIVCPLVEDIDRYTWKDVGTFGLKMIFDWTFEFEWYDDYSDLVPLAPGGLFAITRQWWDKSGKYDSGMLEWGGENIEQSIRVWRCGGEIHVEKSSKVGHIFSRDEKPNPGNILVTQVQRNQKRAALVWLDEKAYKYFSTTHTVVNGLDEYHSGVDLIERHNIKERLNCQSFAWYVNKFRYIFDRKGLLLDNFRHIIHHDSGLCLAASSNEIVTGTEDTAVVFMKCDSNNLAQQWLVGFGRRVISSRILDHGCIDRGSPNAPNLGILRVRKCDYVSILKGENANQIWHFDLSDSYLFDDPYLDLLENEENGITNSGRIFSTGMKTPYSKTGADRIFIEGKKAFVNSNRCLTNVNDKAAMTWCATEHDQNLVFYVKKLHNIG